MRILWLSHKAELGGSELGLLEGTRALANRGHESHVVIPRDGPLRARLEASAHVHICHHNPWVASNMGIGRSARWTAYNLRRAVPDLVRLAKSLDVDVMATNTITSPVAGIAARVTRAPHVWFIHEFGLSQHGLSFPIGRRLTFFLMRQMTSEFLVISEALRRFALQHIPEERVRLVTYAVEVPTQAFPTPETGSFRLTLVGAKTPGKGQAEAVEAVAQLVRAGLDVTLDLVGSGPRDYEHRLEQLIARHGLTGKVRSLPFQEDVHSLVAMSDAALMCSRDEAFGRVTVEAMKLGKPVIGAASGATPELIRHGWNGLLYRPGDSDDLSRQIELLYQDRRLGAELGRRGKKWATERFTLEAYGRDLEAAFRAAAPGGTPGSFLRRTAADGRLLS